jgi:hypothetical protein
MAGRAKREMNTLVPKMKEISSVALWLLNSQGLYYMQRVIEGPVDWACS